MWNMLKDTSTRLAKALSTIEKLNVLADKLASKAISEKKCEELQWNMILGPLLKIKGKLITRKESAALSAAAEINERHKWQSEKLKMSRSEYSQIDWDAQHAA